MLAEYERSRGKFEGRALEAKLNNAARQRFHNHSPLDFEKLKGDPDNIAHNLVQLHPGFLEKRNATFLSISSSRLRSRRCKSPTSSTSSSQSSAMWTSIPTVFRTSKMGLLFENLIRRFNELANETAGDHFTPRDAIRLMVSILFINDDKLLATPGCRAQASRPRLRYRWNVGGSAELPARTP